MLLTFKCHPNFFLRRNVLLALLYYQPQSETPENAWHYFSTLHRNAEIILHPLKWGGATECWFFRTNYLKWVETSAEFAYYDLRHAKYFAMLSTKTRSDCKFSNIFKTTSNIRRCFHTSAMGRSVDKMSHTIKNGTALQKYFHTI